MTGFVWEEEGLKIVFGAQCGEVPYNLWRCWFRRRLVESNGIRFAEGRKYAEDQEFLLKYLLRFGRMPTIVDNTYTINASVYHYTLRPGASMLKQGLKWKKIRDIALVEILFIRDSIRRGLLGELWVLQEMRRMLKALLVVICR